MGVLCPLLPFGVTPGPRWWPPPPSQRLWPLCSIGYHSGLCLLSAPEGSCRCAIQRTRVGYSSQYPWFQTVCIRPRLLWEVGPTVASKVLGA
eukprot:1004252-Rhodomonas_salina.1